MQHAEGTGALYVCDGDKVYVLTARHVVFPPAEGNNELYNHTNVSQPRREVILPGPKAFASVLKSIMAKIRSHEVTVNYYTQQLDRYGLQPGNLGDNDNNMKEQMKKAIKTLNQFHDEVKKYWSEEGQRVLDHVAYSPPITVGTGNGRYTEDWALIELDRSKIDWGTFKGNVMDLGMFSFISPRPSSLTAIFRYTDSVLEIYLAHVPQAQGLHHPRLPI